MEGLQEIDKWLVASAKFEKQHTEKSLLVLFYGMADKAKAATQKLATKHGKELYVVHLSQVVSKYIGETEKNLAAVFQKATVNKCVLFFDEADALFGKRTSVRDANDRYANQEVSYLLQKMEDFEGLIIIATNERKNIDAAFQRRLRYLVEFSETSPK